MAFSGSAGFQPAFPDPYGKITAFPGIGVVS
jgi:hypothetical protein